MSKHQPIKHRARCVQFASMALGGECLGPALVSIMGSTLVSIAGTSLESIMGSALVSSMGPALVSGIVDGGRV